MPKGSFGNKFPGACGLKSWMSFDPGTGFRMTCFDWVLVEQYFIKYLLCIPGPNLNEQLILFHSILATPS